MLYRLYILVLLNHKQVARYSELKVSSYAIHNGRLIQFLRYYNLTVLTSYTPGSISRMRKSPFIDFVKGLRSRVDPVHTVSSAGVELTSATAIFCEDRLA